jgi:LEA14-like dessication related protein
VKGELPEVLGTNVTPLEGTAFEQRLQVDLRIRNPNDFDLLFAGIDFTLNLTGKRLARELDNTTIMVPRLSDTIVSVQTSTSTFDVLR